MKQLVSTIIMTFVLSLVNAATITVTNNNNSGAGSLRQTLIDANNGDTINFSISGVITVTSSLDISKDIVIQGPGADVLAIDGNATTKIFMDGSPVLNTVEISGLEIRNGASAAYGAGIGGASYNLTIKYCDIHSNTLTASYGAAIFVGGIGSSLTIENSSIHDNSVSGFAACISISEGGDIDISNSTLYNNNGSAGGQAIYSYGSDVTLTNVTIAGHTTGWSAISIDDYDDFLDPLNNKAGSFTAVNCIFDNSIDNYSFYSSMGGSQTSLGYNISNDNTMSGMLSNAGDLNNTSALLSPLGLQNNGGTTPTVGLECGSPAIDAGILLLTEDQINSIRYGLGPDIGSHESNIMTLGTDVRTECSPFVWLDGNAYNFSNNTAVFSIVGGAANGCDSLVTLDLTILTTVTVTDTRTECSPFVWLDGNAYNFSNNTAVFNIVGGAANGCDSLITLDLTIVNSAVGTETRTECNSYTWIDGATYTSSNNVAAFNIVGGAANGCDSLITLDLTIINSAAGTETRTECNSYAWIDGTTYSLSNNTATFNIVGGAANGCDSLVSLDLTILNSAIGTETRTECNSYTWIDGLEYIYSNNTATFNIVGGAVNGCDSLVFLDLTINSVSDNTTSLIGATITTNNSSATYAWLDCDNNNSPIFGETNQSFTASLNGNYAVELTENGCVDTSACVAITTVEIMEHFLSNEFIVYPNPTHGTITIEFENVNEQLQVILYSLTGQVIENRIFQNTEKIQLDINAPAGIYILEVIGEDGVSTSLKLLKE
ncbi:MAG: T9SS type A sorting domain-containing protein [Crocinitomicaceae bacterium]|nr:T9SS type A sorting domain-containing protein [Flavobacteriales bacterium]NQZ34873.1 T9SS type A sorting domain-containing protein [Crocinitomicaceae bacterium]